MVKSRKGATEPTLVIGYLVIIILSATFMITVFDKISDMAVIAQSSTTSKDIGTMIEVTYSAPGDVFIDYETPRDINGYTAVGSLLLNGKAGILKTHPLTEDEMWGEISNNALTAWGVGIATKSAYETKKAYNKYAERSARGEIGRLVFETNPGEYSDLLWKSGTMSSDGQNVFKRVLNSRGSGASALKNKILHGGGPGGSVKAILSDKESINVMNKLGTNKQFKEIVQAKPNVLKNIGKAAEADRLQRKVILAETFGLKSAEYKYFTESPEGMKLMDAIVQDPSVIDFLKTSAELENSEDAVGVIRIFGDTNFYPAAIKVADKVQGSGLVKLLATKEGEDALSLFRGGEISGTALPISPTEILKGRSPIGRRQAVLTQRNIGKEMRSIASNKESADAFLEFSKSSEAAEFRSFLMETGARDYNKLMKQVKETEKLGEAERLVKLKKNKDVQKVIKKYGLTDDSLKSITKLNDVSPGLAESLGKSGSWRARVTLANTKSTKATEELLTFASKSEDVAKAAKSKSLYNKLSVSTLLSGGVRKITSAASRAISFTVAQTAGRVFKKATKEATAGFLGKAGEKLGKGVKIGLGNAGVGTSVLAPLEACGKTPTLAAIVCKITAVVVGAVVIGVDVISVTYPMIMMIYMGHKTSAEMKSLDSKFQYIGDADVIYADPANCGSKANSGDTLKNIGADFSAKGSNLLTNLKKMASPEISLSYAWTLISGPFRVIFNLLSFIEPVFGAIGQAFPGAECTQTQIPVDSVQHHTQLDQCYDEGGYCPNYYISTNSFGDLGPIDVDDLATGGAVAYAEGTLVCAGIMWGLPLYGALCYVGYYASLAIAFTVAPDLAIPAFTGCNIYPQEDYWYAQSPTMVQIYREYDEETKKQELSIYAS